MPKAETESPEIPDRGEASEIPGLPSGGESVNNRKRSEYSRDSHKTEKGKFLAKGHFVWEVTFNWGYHCEQNEISRLSGALTASPPLKIINTD